MLKKAIWASVTFDIINLTDLPSFFFDYVLKVFFFMKQ